MSDAGTLAASIPVGAVVVAANGEELGRVHTVHAHYFLVEQGDGATEIDLEVPIAAIAEVGSETALLRVNREALTEVPNERQAAAHRLGAE